MTALNFGSETVPPAIEFWNGIEGGGIICDEDGTPLIRLNPDKIPDLIQNPEAYISDVRPLLELLSKTQNLLAS